MSDRNLLFGMLAVLNDFLDDGHLIAGLNEWKRRPATPLAEILVQQGVLSGEVRAVIDKLVDLNLAKHAQNAVQSIANLPTPAHLRRSVNQALGADSPFDADATISQAASPFVGLRYTKERLHREGGLGAVYRAEDTELRRLIALKEIKPKWADDQTSRENFVREAEITGKLEHPGIVPVYGLGVYADQRPYYAMRFVEGKELKEGIHAFHASKKSYESLEFRSLLDSFIAACNAIAYAHSRGIIHRDIKPQNILLGPFGETLVVDWGLAKVVGRTEKTDGTGTIHIPIGSDSSRTIAGDIKGTPAYMAPEQAQGKVNELGPASDIYGLGGTLYHMLVGKHAFAEKSNEPILNRVTLGRFRSPRSIQAAIPVALEAICLKAMARDASERYSDVSFLVADLKHYLADEPVTARRDPFSLRTKRWMRKHPGTVAALAASILVGTIGLGGGLFAVNAERNRTEVQRVAADEARKLEAMERAKAEIATVQAKKRLAALEKSNGILGSIFKNLDPKEIAKAERPLQAILVDKLDAAVGLLDAEAIGDPIVAVRMQNQFGASLLALGATEKAIALFERSRKALVEMGDSDSDELLTSMNNLGEAYRLAGRIELAVKLQEESLALARKMLGNDHTMTLRSLGNLGEAYRAAGDIKSAIRLHEESYQALKSRLGPEDPDTLSSLNNLASSYRFSGQPRVAMPLFAEILGVRLRSLGPKHPDTVRSVGNLALACLSAGRHDLAVPLNEAALETIKAVRGPEHPETLAMMNNLAGSYWSLGLLERSIPLFEETLRLRAKVLTRQHPETQATVANLGVNYRDAGRYVEAVPLLQEAAEASKRYRNLGWVLESLSDAYLQAGLGAKFGECVESELASQRLVLPKESLELASFLASIASDYLRVGNLGRAEALLTECHTIRCGIQSESWSTFNAKSMLGQALLDQGKTELARPMILEGYAGMKQRDKTIPPQASTRLWEAAWRVSQYYEAIGHKEKAAEWRTKEGKEELPVPKPRIVPKTLAEVYAELGIKP